MIAVPLSPAAIVAPVTLPAFASWLTLMITPRRSNVIACEAFAPIAPIGTVCEVT